MRNTLAVPHIMLTFQDGGSYLGSDPTLGPPALHCDDVVSLLHRVNDSGSVNWANGAEVNDFTAHALPLQLLGCLKSCTHRTGVSHQSEMGAWRGEERRGGEGRGGEGRGVEEGGEEGRRNQPLKIKMDTKPNSQTTRLCTFSLNVCFSNGYEKVRREGLFRYRERSTVHELALQHYHRVEIPDG